MSGSATSRTCASGSPSTTSTEASRGGSSSRRSDRSASYRGVFDSSEAFFGYSSFHLPPTIYRIDLGTGQRAAWEEIDIPIDTEGIAVEQVHYESKDGTRVPMFVVHRKDARRDGSNPTLLVGYGGFDLSLTPSFSGMAAAWVQYGGVFAVANLRGGGELGKAWHEAGMLAQKQNVFDDFVAAGEYLIEAGYTRTEHLAVMGGSNGGLLTGAVLVQRPDLFGAVICTYPPARHAALPPVHGGPVLDRGVRLVARIPSSSPTCGSTRPTTTSSRVRAIRPRSSSPAMGIRASPRCTPARWPRRCKAANSSDAPILIRYHIVAGHSGGQTVQQQAAETAEIWGFLSRQIGWTGPE